jgi:hypothetical protein
VDGDEDTVLYGESQFFESDIIAGDEVGSDSRQMSPADTDEQSARLLRELVAARKMVMTQRDVDVEGEEEDERVSIGSSADTSMTWPPAPTGDGKDAQIEALLAQVKQLVSLPYVAILPVFMHYRNRHWNRRSLNPPSCPKEDPQKARTTPHSQFAVFA